ncbi:hypothetical protein TWF694_009856 [Orbilia ellipsospora]|uniref:Cyanovirin-N domain-containing protein n=1 Tax=Orbilia ellipsospora TaxID=2528407 RepID=A0AAV9XC34_9PEZI
MRSGSIILAFASLSFAGVQASISSQCINIRLQGAWLIANCLTGSGTTRIESSVYLQDRITNTEGVLGWQVNGNYAASCTGCTIVTPPATLSCNCKPTWGQPVPASLNLEGHIAVYNGFILSNLSGTPTPPTTVSTVAFPSDPSWNAFYGNTSCYSTNPETCPSPNVGSGTTCSTYASVSSSDGVANCFAFRYPISVPAWGSFADFKVVAPSGAFKFLVYDTVDCSGGVKGTLAASELGTCKEFNKQMLAFSAVPLWNAQT